uniref:Catalytic, putative n=1 Tax=Arundo donax TaxID=35708 RepID=A0A0A9GQQ7_ARUDO
MICIAHSSHQAGTRLGDDSSRGFFWNSFLSCPQAAFASSPRVSRTLTVIFRASNASTNASTTFL